MNKRIKVILSSDPNYGWSTDYSEDAFVQHALLLNEEFANYVEQNKMQDLKLAILVYMRLNIHIPKLRVEYIEADTQFLVYLNKEGIEQLAIIPEHVSPRIFTAQKFDPNMEYE